MPVQLPPRGLAPSPVPLLLRDEVANAARAVRCGDLVRVTRGVYAPAAPWHALAPWERYLARVHAVARTHAGAALVLESAAAVRNLPGEPPDVHLLLPEPATSRRAPGVRMHTTQKTPALERIDGVLVATSAETVVDLARHRHPAVALSVAAAALRADANLSTAHVAAASAARPTSRGALRPPWVIARASPVPESTLENLSLAVIEWLGFPAPELQRWFRGQAVGEDDRVDMWWPQWGVAGEADGEVKYSGAFGDAREALHDRNVRDARLARRGVRATAHWALRDLVAFSQVRAIITAAGLPLVRREQTAPLATPGRALRGHPAAGILPLP